MLLNVYVWHIMGKDNGRLVLWIHISQILALYRTFALRYQCRKINILLSANYIALLGFEQYVNCFGQ